MNKFIFAFFIMLMVAFTACNSKNSSGEITSDIVANPLSAEGDTSLKDLPKLVLAETKFDFGTILQGQKVTHQFKFTNAGNKDLIIAHAGASCGCTIPEFSKEPIAAGKEGVITVTFDSENKIGSQNKTITILANTMPNTTVLTITADVKKP